MDETKGRNVRVRDGQWHYRFKFRAREYTGATGLAGDVSNRAAAEEFAERLRAKAAEKRPVLAPGRGAAAAVPMDAGFKAAAKTFLAWARDTEYRAKPNTAERIRVSFTSLTAFFGDVPVRRIDAPVVERYKTNRALIDGVREVTIRHDLHALSVFYRWAMQQGLAAVNPVKQVTMPSDRDAIREHVISGYEEKRYFEAAAELHAVYKKSFEHALPALGDVARLMLEQGCRPEEILGARKDSFDSRARTLRILGGKTRSARRTLHLTAASVAILERRAAHRPDSEWMFPSSRHPGRHVTQLAGAHDRACRDGGVSFRLYDFRHTFATRMIEDGSPVAVVAAILGHSGLRVIHRYVHPSEDAQKAAMAAAEKRRAG